MLDMEFFKIMILRRPRQLQQIADVQRIHQALHALRPLDKISAAYTEWSEVRPHSLLICNNISWTLGTLLTAGSQLG